MNKINELAKYIPPPTNPENGGKINWESIERLYKIKLPDDYKELISSYGSGIFGDFIWLINPISKNNNLNFKIIEYIYSSYESMKSDFPDLYPRPSYPNQESYFPWAITDNGDTLIWIVDNNIDSNMWCVGILDSDPETEEIYNIGATELLLKLFNLEIKSNIFPDDFPLENIEFVKESDK